MNRADELRHQIRQRTAEYQARLFDGIEGEHAVMHLRAIRRLEAELAGLESGSDQRQ